MNPTCIVDGCHLPQRVRKHQMCQKHYHRLIWRPTQPACSVEGCARLATGSGICSTHRARLRRTGQLELTDRRQPVITTPEGYRKVIAEPGHPLTDKSNRVYEHRLVLFNRIGEGPHRCHWCNTAIGWSDLHADHLNARRDDNRPENIAAACGPCNVQRATRVRDPKTGKYRRTGTEQATVRDMSLAS
jgi:hypothetical protein